MDFYGSANAAAECWLPQFNPDGFGNCSGRNRQTASTTATLGGVGVEIIVNLRSGASVGSHDRATEKFLLFALT